MNTTADTPPERCTTLAKGFRIEAFVEIWAFEYNLPRAASQAESVAEVGRLGDGERKLALLQRHGLVVPDGLSLVDLQEPTPTVRLGGASEAKRPRTFSYPPALVVAEQLPPSPSAPPLASAPPPSSPSWPPSPRPLAQTLASLGPVAPSTARRPPVLWRNEWGA